MLFKFIKQIKKKNKILIPKTRTGDNNEFRYTRLADNSIWFAKK